MTNLDAMKHLSEEKRCQDGKIELAYDFLKLVDSKSGLSERTFKDALKDTCVYQMVKKHLIIIYDLEDLQADSTLFRFISMKSTQNEQHADRSWRAEGEINARVGDR
jgi:hypothetical protein